MAQHEIKQIGVVGAGLMGSAIATVFAAAKHPVVLFDVNPAILEQSRQISRSIAGELAEYQLIQETSERVADRILAASQLEALAKVDFVLEAISEKLEWKQKLYQDLESVLDQSAIIASNTSGLMPSALSTGMKHPNRFLVAHFWNPPHALPLVEVVPCPATTAAVVESTMALLIACGMKPALISKELPGFIGNRLQYAVLREALAIVRSGVASAEAVDQVMKHSLGRRYASVGPIETADLGGLETFLAISTYLMPQLAKDEEVLDLVREKVEQGKTGLRSGEGFYRWTPELAGKITRQRNRRLLEQRREDLEIRE